jgi:hypothetical protein
VKLPKDPYIVYQCTLPGCTHHERPELLLGKPTRCNVCDEPFLLNRYALTKANPKCPDCIEHKDKDAINAIEEVLKEMS